MRICYLKVMAIVVTLLLGVGVSACELPDDPFQRCAKKALQGDYGELPKWKENAYKWGIAQNVKADKKAVLTSYFPSEGFPRGQSMRSGIGVDSRYAAVVSRDWMELQQFYIWVQPTRNTNGKMVGGLRQIMDTGANSNTRNFAHQYNVHRWVDFWYPEPMRIITAPYCIIKTDRQFRYH